MVWPNLPPYHRFLYFVLLFSTETVWQRGSKHYQKFYDGNLRQTMVDSWYCQAKSARRGGARFRGDQRSGTLNGALSLDGLCCQMSVLCTVWTMSIVKLFNSFEIRIGRSLDTIPCKGVLCIVAQFARVEYNFLLYRFWLSQTSPPHFDFIPKLLLRVLWFFQQTVALVRQIRTFPQLFRFCSDLGNFGIWQIVKNSMLTGRWWERRMLINLCGKNNVRNCDPLQSDFFARCRTVLGVAKGFLWRVVILGKRWGPETLWFFTHEKHATKSHLQALVLGLVRSDISGHEKLTDHPNGALYIFMRSKNMLSSQYYIIYSPPFGWSAPLYSPPKRCEQNQPKTGCVC